MRTALLALLVLSPLRAWAAPPADPRVEVSMPWANTPGFLPLVCTISSRQEYTLRLEARAGRATAAETWVVPPGASRHTLLVPMDEGAWSWQYRWNAGAGFTEWRDAGYSGRDLPVILLHGGETVLRFGGNIMTACQAVTVGGRGGHTNPTFLGPEQMPSRWQGYPQAGLAILSGGDVDRLAPDQLEALGQWARAGGRLLAPSEADAERVAARTGFKPPVAQLGSEEDFRAVLNRLPLLAGKGWTAKVPGTERVPTGGFMVLAVAFAVIAGPLNLFIFRRRRGLLLISTPLLALAFCLALVAFNLVSEGVQVRRVAEQVVELDLQRKEALAWTATVYYAPFGAGAMDLDGRDLVLPFHPLDWNEPDWHLRNQKRDLCPGGLGVDWTGGQHLSGPWVPARINRPLLFVSPRPLRDRLVLERAKDGSLRLTNGLPVAVARFRWWEDPGHLWGSEGLAPGAAVTLEQSGATQMRPCLPPDWFSQFPHPTPLPGRFYAELAAPLLPVTGPAARDATPVKAFCTGVLQPEAAP